MAAWGMGARMKCMGCPYALGTLPPPPPSSWACAPLCPATMQWAVPLQLHHQHLRPSWHTVSARQQGPPPAHSPLQRPMQHSAEMRRLGEGGYGRPPAVLRQPIRQRLQLHHGAGGSGQLARHRRGEHHARAGVVRVLRARAVRGGLAWGSASCACMACHGGGKGGGGGKQAGTGKPAGAGACTAADHLAAFPAALGMSHRQAPSPSPHVLTQCRAPVVAGPGSVTAGDCGWSSGVGGAQSGASIFACSTALICLCSACYSGPTHARLHAAIKLGKLGKCCAQGPPAPSLRILHPMSDAAACTAGWQLLAQLPHRARMPAARACSRAAACSGLCTPATTSMHMWLDRWAGNATGQLRANAARLLHPAARCAPLNEHSPPLHPSPHGRYLLDFEHDQTDLQGGGARGGGQLSPCWCAKAAYQCCRLISALGWGGEGRCLCI